MMDNSVFICPVCSALLLRDDRSYICINSHTYDIAKDGYVNLLLANQKQTRDPGDSKEMIDARKSFLSKGYYKPLARAVASSIIKYRRRSLTASLNCKMTYCQRRDLKILSNRRFDRLNVRTFSVNDTIPITETVETPAHKSDFTILDAGCGEGYYTDYISRNRIIGGSSVIYGIDISREGIKSASKRNSAISYAVAGIYKLPALSSSVDLLLNIFAPFNEDEFARVLKKNGIILSVTPGALHLYEFKKNLYDEVYLNDEEFRLSDKFYTSETIRIRYELNIHSREDIANLLKMTPYYHKSPREKMNSFLESVNELKTTADFIIRIIYRKDDLIKI